MRASILRVKDTSQNEPNLVTLKIIVEQTYTMCLDNFIPLC